MSPKKDEAITPEAIADHNYLVRAIRSYYKDLGLTQTKLAQMAKKSGFNSQGSISKKLKQMKGDGETEIAQILTYTEACTLCRIMNTTLGTVLQKFEQKNDHIPEENSLGAQNLKDSSGNAKNIPIGTQIFPESAKLTNNILDPMFKSWFGKFHCYFYSTLSTEDTCFYGTLEIPDASEDGVCHVTFEFVYDKETGQKKEYYGNLILSKVNNGAYCILYNHDDLGEITFLTMSNPSRMDKPVCCLVAFALTISGGRHTKHPCIERMILSREVLEEDRFQQAAVHLRMNDKYIRLERDQLLQLLKDPALPEVFQANYRPCEDPFVYSIFSEYRQEISVIPESRIQSIPFGSEEEKRMVADLLRKYSTAPKYNKINERITEKDIFSICKDSLNSWVNLVETNDLSEESD